MVDSENAAHTHIRRGKKSKESLPPLGTTLGTTPSGATLTTSLTEEKQDATMLEERKFLAEMMDAAMKGDGPKVVECVAKYRESHPELTAKDVLGDFKDGSGRTVLHFACQGEAPKIADADKEDIVPFLLTTSGLLTKDEVESLCRIKESDGLTPLMVASRHSDKHLSAVRIDALLSAGGTKLSLARSRAGGTALHYAAGAGAPPTTIRQLHDAGKVALNTNSVKGGTPLHWCAGVPPPDNFSDTLRALLECGADVDAKSDEKAGSMTALVLATAASNDAHAKLLVEAGADRTPILDGGVTVYHMAADLNLAGTLAALLNADRDHNDSDGPSVTQKYLAMKNGKGETPLDLAAQEGHTGCVMLLLPDGENSEEDAAKLIEAKKEEAREREDDDLRREAERKERAGAKSKKKDDGVEDREGVEAEASRMVLEIRKRMGTVSDEDRSAAQRHRTTGNTHFARKEWQKALNAYSAAIESDPTDATFYSNRSTCHLQLSSPSPALRDAAVARQLRPNWAKGAFRLAMARLEMGRYEDAALAAWEGVQLEPDNEEMKSLLQKCVDAGKGDNKEKASSEAGQ